MYGAYDFYDYEEAYDWTNERQKSSLYGEVWAQAAAEIIIMTGKAAIDIASVLIIQKIAECKANRENLVYAINAGGVKYTSNSLIKQFEKVINGFEKNRKNEKNQRKVLEILAHTAFIDNSLSNKCRQLYIDERTERFLVGWKDVLDQINKSHRLIEACRYITENNPELVLQMAKKY